MISKFTTCYNIKKIRVLPPQFTYAFLGFVQKFPSVSLNSINGLVFVTHTDCVLCEVWTACVAVGYLDECYSWGTFR
jgi:hypothetical protein